MRTLLALLVFSCLIAVPLRAQSDSDSVDLPEPRRGGGGIIGFGGGVSGTMALYNMTDLNSQLAAKQFPALSDKGMFLFGGHGYAYIVLVPNLRIGGMGAGGSIETIERLAGTYRSSKFATSFGGVTLEYVIPFKRLHLAFGGMLGGGTRTLTLTQASDRDKHWSGLFDPLGDIRHELTQSFFAWQPWASLEWEFHPLAVLSLTGGWSGARNGAWRLDNAFDVQDVPDFKLDRAFVRLGLTVGFFLPEE